MTAIAVPIFVHEAAGAIAAMHAAVGAGATMVELRCDTAGLGVIEEVVRAKRDVLVGGGGRPVEVIVTIRPTWEGGFYDGDDQQRISLFEHAGLAGADYIDVELAAWKRSANLRQKVMLVCRHPGGGGTGKDDGGRERGARLILSSHDFTGRPADLAQRVAALEAEEAASILKIVWKAGSVVDGVDALRLVREHAARDARPMVALAMGEFGQISRLLAAKFGAAFTFGTLPGAEGAGGSAPGQPSVEELLGMYRWGKQERRGGGGATTPVFGVIGWPIGHSLSPAIHNAGFDALGLEGVYVPLPIMPEYAAFAAAVDALRRCPGMNLRGLSVTIPHKDNALRYLLERGGEVDELSRHIGAVNTIVWSGDAAAVQPRGFNSDYAGALDALVAAMGVRREDLAGRRVGVIGAGGAARAIVAGLAACGAVTTIYARRAAQAAALAADFDGKTGKVAAGAWGDLAASGCEIYINCTPVGMYPREDASPMDGAGGGGGGGGTAFTRETVVFDTVYRPRRTKLLRQAEAAGARTVTGVEMFVRQAAVQFEAFTGRAAPMEVFRRVMEQTLNAER